MPHRRDMMQNPLVTIAIPAYKAEYVRDALQSAMRQTYQNLEVLVVDDSPEEKVHDMTKCCGDKIRYEHNASNLGALDPSRNWNRCLELAKGEFICILCDDDRYDPEYVATMVGLLEKYPAASAFRSGVKQIDGEGKVTAYFPLSAEYLSVEEYIWHLHSGNNRQTISEWMMRTEALRAMGGYAACPKAWGSDCITVFRLAESGGVVSSPLRLTSYRDSGMNISGAQYAHNKEKIEGWRMQCRTANEILEKSANPDKMLISREVVRDQRRWTKNLAKHASWSELCAMRKEPEKYGITGSLLMKGLLNNVLWALRLKKRS